MLVNHPSWLSKTRPNQVEKHQIFPYYIHYRNKHTINTCRLNFSMRIEIILVDGWKRVQGAIARNLSAILHLSVSNSATDNLNKGRKLANASTSVITRKVNITCGTFNLIKCTGKPLSFDVNNHRWQIAWSRDLYSFLISTAWQNKNYKMQGYR